MPVPFTQEDLEWVRKNHPNAFARFDSLPGSKAMTEEITSFETTVREIRDNVFREAVTRMEKAEARVLELQEENKRLLLAWEYQKRQRDRAESDADMLRKLIEGLK